MNWLSVFKHLLPSGRAWRITTNKMLRSFIDGLRGAPEDAREFIDNVYLDIFPATTRRLDEYENQFGLPAAVLTEQQRRDRLDAAWKATGGQSPRYIQDTLQGAGFPVYVHEWWVPDPLHPTGGSVNGDSVPVARDPFAYLWDGVSERQFIGCGHNLAMCGGDVAFANSQNEPPGYPLVNKVLIASSGSIGAGYAQMYCGGDLAACGASVVAYNRKQYVIPADPTKYPHFLYIGGETFPDLATIPGSRREEFEDLCLKICPTEKWLGMLVDYT